MDEIKQDARRSGALSSRIENAKIAIELLESEEDESIEKELQANLKQISSELDSFEEDVILSDTYDSYPAIVTIHPGAGGTESHDWAEMLLRMYRKWLDEKR